MDRDKTRVANKIIERRFDEMKRKNHKDKLY